MSSEEKSSSGGRKILLAGEGGQGVQAIAEILALAANNSDKYSSYIPNFGVEQRGGVSLAYLIISSKPIRNPKFEKADIIVVMCGRAIERIKTFLSQNTLFIYDNSNIEDYYFQDLKNIIKKSFPIPAKNIALEKLSIKVANIIVLGAIIGLISDFDSEVIKKTIEEKFAKYIAKKPELKDLNFNALDAGLELAKNSNQDSSLELKGTETFKYQNEYKDKAKKWQRFPEYCKGCGLCLVSCPVKALQFSHDIGFLGNPMPVVDIAKCTACQTCMHICPEGAIEVEKFE